MVERNYTKMVWIFFDVRISTMLRYMLLWSAGLKHFLLWPGPSFFFLDPHLLLISPPQDYIRQKFLRLVWRTPLPLAKVGTTEVKTGRRSFKRVHGMIWNGQWGRGSADEHLAPWRNLK
jgi:hypothetical protein